MKVDLLDIAPATNVAVVKIDAEREMEVRGFPINEMASIIVRYPLLITIFKGGPGDEAIPQMIMDCAASVGPIIAAGTGHFADEAYEQHAASLPVSVQVKLLKAIMGLICPNGIGSFVVDLTTLLMIGSPEGAVEKPVKMRSRILPSASQPSSDEASPPTLQ